ncbi:hypothetical protein M9H77_21207 [Catharanthus roseus]|uniref:Uncharacterized protein n=1 Tax=Catharanthus roseus TaxID=4058 RepID=A0ACC0AM27_CATRO|nr:hypothetical protein M9H77_21207 [Catharanthus roseus]
MELGEIIRHYLDYYQNCSNMIVLQYRIPISSEGSTSCTSTHIVCISSSSTFRKKDGGDIACRATFAPRMRPLFMLIAVRDYPTTCCTDRICCDNICSGLDPYQHVHPIYPTSENERPYRLYHEPHFHITHLVLFLDRIRHDIYFQYFRQERLSFFCFYFPESRLWRLDMYTNIFIDDQPSMVAYGNLGIARRESYAQHLHALITTWSGFSTILSTSSDVGFSTCSALVDIGFSATIAELSYVSLGVTTCLPITIEGSSSSVGEFCNVSSHVTTCSPRMGNEGSSASIGAICYSRINESWFTKTVGEVGSLASEVLSATFAGKCFPTISEACSVSTVDVCSFMTLPYVRHHILLFFAIPYLHKVLLSLLRHLFFPPHTFLSFF